MEPNVLLIVCDSLNKALLDIYGGPAKTPNLHELLEDSVLYDNAIAPSSWTFPSHVSLFTGLYPNEHGVHETEQIKLLDLAKLNFDLKATRLQSELSNRGYISIGLSNNPMVSSVTGFDIGFDLFLSLDPFPANKNSKTFQEAREMGSSQLQIALKLVKSGNFNKLIEFAKFRKNEKLVSKVNNFPLDKGAFNTNKMLENGNWRDKFFMFINFLEVHEPYRNFKSKWVWDNVTGTKPISKDHVSLIKKEYITEMEYLDLQIGRLLSNLKKAGKYDNTLIIVTSDHGQAMNEHGYMFHSTYLYDELTRIPLIIKYPNNKKFEPREGYQSLVKIYDLIKSIMEGGDDSVLFSETAFSETYGTASNNLPGGYNSKLEYFKKTHDKVRKSIYKKDYKLTVNGTDGTIEEFLYKDKPIPINENREIINELINELDIFKGKERFILPSLN